MKNYSFWALLSAQFLTLSLFLPTRFGGLGAIIFCFVSVIGLITKQYRIKNLQVLWVFPLIFLVLMIGASYAENTAEAFKLIERNLSFILFPFLAQSVTIFSHKQWKILFYTYLLSAFVISSYCIFLAFNTYLETGSTSINNSDHFIYNIFMHQRLTAPIGIHAIYLNSFISFGGIMSINKLVKQWRSLKRTEVIFLIAYLIFNGVMMYLLKSSILAAAVPFVLVVIHFKKIKRFVFASNLKMGIALLLLVVSSLFFYSIIKTKLGNFEIKKDYSAESIGPLNIRLAIWEGAFGVIQKNWIIGVGTGNLEEPILKEFSEINFTEGINSKYNAHNMFLQYWAMNGLPGIISFLLLLICIIYWSIKKGNNELLALVILFAIFSITESTLQTQRGILFFGFLCATLYWKDYPKNLLK